VYTIWLNIILWNSWWPLTWYDNLKHLFGSLVLLKSCLHKEVSHIWRQLCLGQLWICHYKFQ